MVRRLVPFVAVALVACKPPPPAPEGLDASSKYMVQNFYADDAIFQAGVQGFLNWFEDEGKELLGLVPGDEGKETDAFTVEDLTAEDVAHLPLDPQILDVVGNPDDPADDVFIDRDTTAAAGVVSLAEMACTWQEAEELLLRKDQNTVFSGDWEGYERTYVTARGDYEDGTSSGDYVAIDEELSPYEDGFDASAYGSTLLFTDNMADPTPLLGVDIPSYPLRLEFRHGVWDLEDGTQAGGFVILTYNASAVWGPTGDNGLAQSYSIELNIERPNGKTLRTLAVWAEPRSPIIGADATLALNFAVKKSLDSSIRLSDVCAGEVEVPDEP